MLSADNGIASSEGLTYPRVELSARNTVLHQPMTKSETLKELDASDVYSICMSTGNSETMLINDASLDTKL